MKRTLQLIMLVCLFCNGLLFAQTTISTNHVNNNGNGGVTFHVQNTNAYDIVVTEILCHLGTSTTNNCQLLTNPTPLFDNSPPWSHGTIGDGQNGWVLEATATVSSNTANGVVSAISGMEVLVPANTTVGFAFAATTLQYMTLSAGTNTFSGDGVNLLTGDGISWGSIVYPSTPANYPRGLIGGIVFEIATPCTSPPTAGTISIPSATVCPSTPIQLSVPSGGLNMTYQWQSSLTNDQYVSISGATSRKYTANQTANHYYRCYVTCGGLSDTTAGILLSSPAAAVSTLVETACVNEVVTVNGIDYSSTGVYTQVLTGAASSGCDSTITIDVTILDAIETFPNVTICANGSHTVGSNTYTVADTYVDVLTSVDGCDSTVTTTLSVEAAQDISTSVAGATIMATTTGAIYAWLDADDNFAAIPNEDEQTFTPPVSGNYAVIITEGACSDTSAAVNITVTDLTLYQSNGLAFQVSPNPANASTTIVLSGVEFQNAFTKGVNLVLVNALNETVFSTKVYSEKTTVDMSLYQNGLYFLQLNTGDKLVTEKIIKN